MSSYESPQLRNTKNMRKPELSPLSTTTPKGRSRAVSESYLSSPLRAALNSAKRVLQVSGRSNSAAVDYSHVGNDAQSYGLSSARPGHGSFLDSPYRARDRRPVFGLDAGSSRKNERGRSQTLTGSLPVTHSGPKPVRPERPSPEVDLDLIAQPPPAISSARLAASGHLRKRATSIVPEPSPLAHEDDTDNLKTPTLASCIQFGSRAPLPQFTPRFIFEEFERVYRAEDELLRAKLAEDIPKIQEPKPMPPMTYERERILREDRLLAPTPNQHHGVRHPGLALAFPVSLPAPVFKPDDLNFRKQASPYRHRDEVDNTSPDRLESSSRMMKLFENYLENTPKTGNHRSLSDVSDPSPSSSLRRLRSRLTFEEETLTKTLSRKQSQSLCAQELLPRTPAFGTRRTTTSISKVNTPGNIRDERSPDSDDGVDESPQTPSTGGVPAVRVGVAAEHDLISTPPRAMLEAQLEKVLGNRDSDATWDDATPSARPRTPEIQRRSPFNLGALSNAASRLAHLREQSAPASQKVKKPSENTGWKLRPSTKPTREARDQLVGRVLFDEETRNQNQNPVGFSSLKQLMGLKRGSSRTLTAQADPLVAGPLLEDLKTPSSVTRFGPIGPSTLASTPEDDLLSPCRAYGKRQGTWETGNWTRGDLNLRLPEVEQPIEDVIDTVKVKQLSKTRILRRAARASALAARNAATGLGIRA